MHNSGSDTNEKNWTYDPDRHLYHVKSTAESQDAQPEATGQFVGDLLVLEQTFPPFGSTGLQPNVHNGVLEVMKVFPGYAAEKAGLRKGDVITKIDGKSLAGIDYPNTLLTGQPDTDVVVTVRHKNDPEHDVTLRRKEHHHVLPQDDQPPASADTGRYRSHRRRRRAQGRERRRARGTVSGPDKRKGASMTKRQAHTLMALAVAIIVTQILCTAVLLRGMERSRRAAETVQAEAVEPCDPDQPAVSTEMTDDDLSLSPPIPITSSSARIRPS